MNNTTNGLIKDYIYYRAMHRESQSGGYLDYTHFSNMTTLSEIFFRLHGTDIAEAADAYLAAHN